MLNIGSLTYRGCFVFREKKEKKKKRNKRKRTHILLLNNLLSFSLSETDANKIDLITTSFYFL